MYYDTGYLTRLTLIRWKTGCKLVLRHREHGIRGERNGMHAHGHVTRYRADDSAELGLARRAGMFVAPAEEAA